MDFFKAISNWLGWGDDEKDKKRPTTTSSNRRPSTLQLQRNRAAQMPKVFNQQGQQNWLKKNAPLVYHERNRQNQSGPKLPTLKMSETSAPSQSRQTPRPRPEITDKDISRGDALSKFNKASLGDQRRMRRDIEKRQRDARLGYSDSEAKRASQLSKTLRQIDTKGKKKPGNPATFAEDIVQGTLDSWGNAAKQIGRGTGMLTGQTERSARRIQTQADRSTEQLAKQLRDGKISRERFRQLNASNDEQRRVAARMLDRQVQDTDPRRMAGAVVTAGMAPFEMLGVGKAAKAGASIGGKLVPGRAVSDIASGMGAGKKLAARAAENVAVGTPAAFADPFVEGGADTRASDVAASVGMNTLFGAAIPAGAAGLGYGARQAARGARRAGELLDEVEANRIERRGGAEDRVQNTQEAEVVPNRPTSEAQVTTQPPRTPAERQEAINRGVITPETKSLPLEQRLATALNSTRAAGMDSGVQIAPMVADGATMRTMGDGQAPEGLAPAMDGQAQMQGGGGAGYGSSVPQDLTLNPNSPANSIMPEPAAAYRLEGDADMPVRPPEMDSVDPRAREIFGAQRGVDMDTERALRAESMRLFGDNNVHMADQITDEYGNPALGVTNRGDLGESSDISIRRNQADAEATFFHEAVHKALNDYMQPAERRAILEDYGRQQQIDGNIRDIEERMAEDFIEFVAVRRNRGAAPQTITQRIAEVFERVWERIQEAFRRGDPNISEQFMQDLYDGRFATMRRVNEMTPEQVELNNQYQLLQQSYQNAPSQTLKRQINEAMVHNRDEYRRVTPQQQVAYREAGDDPRYLLAGQRATGFNQAQEAGQIFDGIDGKQRFEVDDSRSRVKNPEGKTLGEMLDHPDLFENYPSLKDAPIEYDMRGDLGPASAAIQNLPNGKTGILVNPYFANKPDELRKYLLHETQHLIQKDEGFARGTSPEAAIADFNKSFDAKHGKRLSEIRNEIEDISRDEQFRAVESELNQVYQELFDGDVNNPELNRRARTLEKKIESQNRRIEQLAKERNDIESRRISDMEAYERSAGEAEARAVQARRDMPMSERYVTPKTADEYAMSHRPDPEGATLDDISNKGEFVPEDIYDNPQWYGDITDAATRKSLEVIRKVRNDPEAEVTVYRAAPKNELNSGDWISLSKEYAQGESQVEGTKVHSFKVKAKELRWPGDSFNEFGYYPDMKPRSTFYDSLDVPKDQLITRNDSGKAMSVEGADTPRKRLNREIDNVIYEQAPELFHARDMNDGMRPLGEGGSSEIPRLHVDDIRHYFGHTEDIPSRYKRTTGKRDIDEQAAMAGFDDIDEFVEHIQATLQSRREIREYDKLLAEMRRDPEVRAEAERRLKANEAQAQHQAATQQPKESTSKTQSDPTYRESSRQGSVPGDQAASGAPLTQRTQESSLGQTRTTDQSQGKTYADSVPSESVAWQNKPSDPTERLVFEDDKPGLAVAQERDGHGWRNKMEPAIESPTDYRAIDNLSTNEDLHNMAVKAMDDGTEIHLYADKNAGDIPGTYASVSKFNPDWHTIDNGLVKDTRTGATLGNHIKVDDTGIHISIGKSVVNMDAIVGDISKWKDMNKASWTMDRMLEKAAPNDKTYRQVRSFVIEHKQKSEAGMRQDLKKFRDDIYDWRKSLMDVKPSGVKKDDFATDIFHYAERKLAQEKGMADGKKLTLEQILEHKYGKQTANRIQEFDKWARNQYDEMLDKTNKVLKRFGYDEVPKRENYMTHLQEDSLWDKIGIGEDLYRDLSAGIMGEMNPTNRGKLPGNIAGMTQDFKPTKRYNPFHQRRRGKDSMTDPFKAMDAYGEAALFNIHMTESAVRARSLESVFKAAEEIVNNDMLKTVNKELRKSLGTKLKGNRSDLINAFMEYTNALTGKSSFADRVVQDKFGVTGRALLRASRGLQKVASQSSIVGNVAVTIAQSLNLPNVIRTHGTTNMVRGVSRLLKDTKMNGDPKTGTPAAQSDFLKVRYTDATSRVKKSGFQKLNDKVSEITLMKQVERSFVELAWNSSYERALRDGHKGKAAIKEADRMTERIVAGRGIADQPELYRSTTARTFLQYTLEVNAALKNLRHDGNIGGVAQYAVAVFVMNHLVEGVTGRAPLPDFIDATVESVKDFASSDDDEDDTVVDNIKQAAQRYGSEVVGLSPIVSAGVNTLFGKDDRKSWFGDESDLGRYDGTPAASGVVSKMINAFMDLTKGDVGGAVDKSFAAVPFGSQIRKTTGGISSMLAGHVDSNAGRTMTSVNTSNPLRWVQAALFGKNAIPEVKAYWENNQRPLSEKQQKIFDSMKSVSKEAANNYLESVMAGRSSTTKGASVSDNPDMAEMTALKDVNVAEGTWKVQDGLIVNKKGHVQRDFYRKRAAARGDQSDAAYKDWMKGYGLDETKRSRKADTGNKLIDKLISEEASASGKVNKGNAAISMFMGDSKYDDMPEWVREKYYKKAGFTKQHLTDGALASMSTDTRLNEYYKPIHKELGKEALLDALYDGRKRTIYSKGGTNYMAANDGLIDSLRREGILTSEEAKYLKGIKLDKDGKVTNNESGSSRSGRGRGRGGGKSSPGYTQADIKRYLDSIIIGQGGSAVRSIVQQAGKSGGGAPKLSSPTVNLRSLVAQTGKNKAKGSKRMLG